jgi:hypothetical protein
MLQSTIKISKQQMVNEKHYKGLQKLRRRSNRLLLLNGILHGFVRCAYCYKGNLPHLYSLKNLSFTVDQQYSMHKSTRSIQML